MKKNLKQLGRAGIMLTLVFALVLSVSPAFADAGATLDDLTIGIGDSWANIDTDVTVTSTADDFSDGYVEFAVTSGVATDEFQIVDGGLITVVGDAVYYDGDRVGTIDNTYDGSNGRLRVNFTSSVPLTNSSFETGDMTGWTEDASHDQLNGESWAVIPTGFSSCTPMDGSKDSAPTVDDGDTWSINEGSASMDQAHSGSYSLKLELQGGVTLGCDSSHSPSVISDNFTGMAGDSISLWYYGLYVTDAADFYGFVTNSNGDRQFLFHDTIVQSATAAWTNVSTAISTTVCPSSETCTDLKFEFMNGTFDATGGKAIHSSLYVDDIVLTLATPPAAVTNVMVEAIIENTQYLNISATPVNPKPYTINFLDADAAASSSSADILFEAPEMDVSGLGVEIADGDVSPDLLDDTDFGTVTAGTPNANTFTITNTGDANLNLTSIILSGHTDDFTLTGHAISPVAINGGTTTFEVTFDPTADGLREATVSIVNDDSDENPYTFDIQGNGVMDAIPPTVVSIVRNGISPTSLQSVSYTVVFSETVNSVDAADFTITASGPYGASVTNVIGFDNIYVVTIDTGVGNGTVRLDVLAASASIVDTASNALVADFTSGEEYYVVKSVSTLADFDGDGKDDIAVFRPSDGSWRIQGQGVYFYGEEGDIPVPADYNGDGKDDIAVFRPSNGTWYVRGQGSYNYGEVGDIPVPGDYNGDGTDDIAIFRASNHTWYVYGQGTYFYGNEGDIPVPADYDGNGTTDVAVFRGSNHTWYVYGQGTTVYGDTGDIPVPADYNGDGKADVAIWRPSTGNWHIYAAGVYNYGAVGDIPLMGDYDGNGNYDISVWRPLNGTWYIQGVGAFVYGASGDIPVEPEYLPKMEP